MTKLYLGHMFSVNVYNIFWVVHWTRGYISKGVSIPASAIAAYWHFFQYWHIGYRQTFLVPTWKYRQYRHTSNHQYRCIGISAKNQTESLPLFRVCFINNYVFWLSATFHGLLGVFRFSAGFQNSFTVSVVFRNSLIFVFCRYFSLFRSSVTQKFHFPVYSTLLFSGFPQIFF